MVYVKIKPCTKFDAKMLIRSKEVINIFNKQLRFSPKGFTRKIQIAIDSLENFT